MIISISAYIKSLKLHHVLVRFENFISGLLFQHPVQNQEDFTRAVENLSE